ncbi:MAG: hypothetical protein QF577_07640 [Phycisphaerae bacterium]|nr:hypothetical protein [Phycisphaerae bacterium]MDP7637404.1 hypothetical protein [Phycisphaerae bacterium]
MAVLDAKSKEAGVREASSPALSPKASGTTLCVSVGSRKHQTVENNILEIDNNRVMQVSPETPGKK